MADLPYWQYLLQRLAFFDLFHSLLNRRTKEIGVRKAMGLSARIYFCSFQEIVILVLSFGIDGMATGILFCRTYLKISITG
jgi:hypothetical protein